MVPQQLKVLCFPVSGGRGAGKTSLHEFVGIISSGAHDDITQYHKLLQHMYIIHSQ